MTRPYVLHTSKSKSKSSKKSKHNQLHSNLPSHSNLPNRPPQYSQPQYSPDDNFAYNPNYDIVDDIVDVVVPESKMTDKEFYTHYNPMGAPPNFSSGDNDEHRPYRVFSIGIPDPSSKKRTREKSPSSSRKQTKRKKTKKGGKSRKGKSRKGKSRKGKSRKGKSRRGKSRSI